MKRFIVQIINILKVVEMIKLIRKINIYGQKISGYFTQGHVDTVAQKFYPLTSLIDHGVSDLKILKKI